MNIEVNKLTDVKTEIGNLQVIYLEGPAFLTESIL